MADLKKMIEELAANPEKINDMKDEDLENLWKDVSPYETTLSPGDKRILAMAYTNHTEDYLTKFLTTALVAFMYRRAKEFKIMPHKDDDTQENVVGREVVTSFLSSMFEYDPDKHVQEGSKPPKTKEEIELARKTMAFESPGQELPHEKLVSKFSDKEKLGSNTVPNDTFAWFKMYKSDNFEALRWATMVLYGVLPSIELMVQPTEIFDGPNPGEEYKVYEQMHKDNVKFGITALTFGSWNILGPFTKNKDKVSFANKNTEILSRILEQHKADEAIGAELLKRRVKERKKENIRRDGPDAENLQEHLKDVPRESLGSVKVLSEEDKAKLADEVKVTTKEDNLAIRASELLAPHLAPDAPIDSVKVSKPINTADYDNDYNPPDDAVTVNVFTTDKKGMKKSHFFTESMPPDVEEKQTKERFDTLAAEEERQNEIKRNAERLVKSKTASRRGGRRH
jgi:hypothetical protein